MLLVADHTDWYSLRYITYEGVLELANTGATVFATDKGKLELLANEEKKGDKRFWTCIIAIPILFLKKVHS